MAFTVPIGSGAAIIPCGNTTATTRCTRFFPSSIRTPSNHLYLACPKKFSSESHRFRAVTEPQATAEIEDEEPLDEEFVALYSKVNDFLREEPYLWEGPQWDLLGFFVQYSWIIGFGVAVCVSLYGCLTYQEPPKEVREEMERKYGVRSGVESGVESDAESGAESRANSSSESSDVFEETDAYDSDVFDSNPTEVAPSLD
ncbi:hypothetical protein LR48_Vigan10g020400 [Vigna angularis]|uniref:Uncharacterized protein n=2 Tax=Phaseolus angularis TaxID=3914 RepID=A0A0L9VHB0_PHAAN|nr:uncharacterized protein LOC108344620 [Vigna angularis]KAG2385215.1 uncharacterized protein HKW66_Vig0123070 [Vigna angularis]KOM54312.1 hypothetical protein LR48_Vigan10g020400 [Vigna angularis]BAU02803.1 hypothetical protein VIGAN_11238700 [Vigna angularis var. angularis]